MTDPEHSSEEEFFSFETNSSSTEAFGTKDDTTGDYVSAESKSRFDNSTDCDADHSSIDDSPRNSTQLARYLLKKNARNLKKIRHMFHILHENGTLATEPKYKPFEIANNIIVTCQTKLRLFTGEFQIKEEQFYVNTSRNTEYKKGGKIASINPNKFQFLHSVKYNKCIVVERINSNQVVNVCNIENETVQFICLGEEYEDMWEYWRIMNSLSATTVDEFCSKVNKCITTKQDMEIIDNRELMYSYITQNLVSSEHIATFDLEYKKPAFKFFFDFALKLNTRVYELLTLRHQLNCRKSRKATTCSTSRIQSTIANNNASSSFVSVNTKYTESLIRINVKSENQISTKGSQQKIQTNDTRQQQNNVSGKTTVENQMSGTRKKNNAEEANLDKKYILSEQLILPQVVIRFGTPNVLRLVNSAYSVEKAKKLSEIFNSEWYKHFVSQVYDPYSYNLQEPSMAACSKTSQSGTCSDASKEPKTKNAEVQTPPIKKKVNIRCDVCTETEDIISGNRYVRPTTVFKYNNSFFCDGTEGEDFKQDIYKMPEYKLFGDDWQYQSPIFSSNYRAPPPQKKTEKEPGKMETLWVRQRKCDPEKQNQNKEIRKSYSLDHCKSGPRPAEAPMFHMGSNNVTTAVNFASNYLSEGNELRLNCSEYQQLDSHLHPQSYFEKIANGYEHLGGQQGSSAEDIRLSINSFQKPQHSQEHMTVNYENIISAEDILNNAIIRSSHFLRSNCMETGIGKLSAHDRATESRCHSQTTSSVCEVPYIIINPNNLRREIEQFVVNDPSISAVKQFFNVGMQYPMHLMYLPANLELLARADINTDNVLLNENHMSSGNASEQLALIPHPWLLTLIHPNCAALGFWRSLWPPFYFNLIAKRRLKTAFTFNPGNPYK
ncbi:uncharacterized protein LOC119662267 isoform X2 [Teleopsis dalmanni]|uniref:uncharacterized protein LOC119662267 isoform X2 n=1 Tax=Teleopsis dalmanni TaxID=139649 RepID=UPI0018CCF561|nr:uncharacterized protein LOC119662267 isoform X2 [Teleopsis dalmanni]